MNDKNINVTASIIEDDGSTTTEPPQDDNATVATVTEKKKTRAKKVPAHVKIAPIGFDRKDADKQQSRAGYFYGLVPSTNRGSITVGNVITFSTYTGKQVQGRDETIALVDQIGDISDLTKDQVEDAIRRVKKTGIRFTGGMHSSPKKFTIMEDNPSDHAWKHNEFPLGRFCYLHAIVDLDKKYGGGESTWRSKSVPMETMIPRSEKVVSGIRDSGNGWSFPNPPPKPPKDPFTGETFHGDFM